MVAWLNYRYSWVLNALDEGASFAFYVFLFYNFKPIERNPYLVIDEEEENDARNLLETDRFGDTRLILHCCRLYLFLLKFNQECILYIGCKVEVKSIYFVLIFFFFDI